MKHKIIAVVPAFNEASTIGSVVSKIKKFATPLVVNDGSADDTKGIAEAHGAIVFDHVVNRGYEQALQSGFEKAVEMDCEYVITLDADGQHDPTTIAKFHEKIKEGYDVVVGVRDKRQRISESIFSFVGKLRWGLEDPLCGMKAYRTLALKDAMAHLHKFNSVGTKYALWIVSHGGRPYQIPIITSDRKDKPRFGSGIKANIRIAYSMLLALSLI